MNFSYEPNQEVPLLGPVSCELPLGKVVCLRGPAGAGKSAVLKLMAGLLSPQAGSIEINGLPVTEMSFEEFLPYRLQIGYGFEYGGLLNNRTLAENLALPLQYHSLYSNEEIQTRVSKMLEIFQLTSQAHKRPSTVAGSQRKATCVARALVNSPQFLILDDPTTGLSAIAKSALVDWIKNEMKHNRLRYVLISSEEAEWTKRLSAIDLEVTGGQLIWTNKNKESAA